MHKSTGLANILRCLLRPALVILVVFSNTSSSFADGCYIPARAVRKIPEITGQRALVTWKDGVETLVISSALDSKSQELGWIIPLPAVPDTIEKETPGILRTINFNIQPRITHDPVPGLPTVLFWVFLANLMVAVFLFRRHRFCDLLLIIMTLAILSAALFPSLATVRSSATKISTTLHLEKTVKAGAYDITVLRSKNVQDLNAWLEENGFASLPAQATPVVADYIRDGWVFSAIKLVREEGGANTPHPIKMVFKAKAAVYPLKLTAVAGGTPTFEIFVIADQKVACNLLTAEFCDRFAKYDDRQNYHVYGYETAVSFIGATTRINVGHPAICNMMWDGCVLTKLSGAINSTKMTEDLHFERTAFRSYQRHLYTRAGATEAALMLMAGLMGAILFVSMIISAKRICRPWGLLWYCGSVLFPSLTLTGLCAFLFLICVPKLSPSEVQVSRSNNNFYPVLLGREIEELVADNPELAKKQTEEIGAYLLANVFTKQNMVYGYGTNAGNRITGDKIVIEDSPGNFTLKKGETNIAIRIYDKTGRPRIYDFLVGEAARRQNLHKR